MFPAALVVFKKINRDELKKRPGSNGFSARRGRESTLVFKETSER